MKTLLKEEDKGGQANAEAASEATGTGVRGASDSEQVGSEAQKFCWCVHGVRGKKYTHAHARARAHTHTQIFLTKIGLL